MVLVSIRARVLWARAGHCIIYILYTQDKCVSYTHIFSLPCLTFKVIGRFAIKLHFLGEFIYKNPTQEKNMLEKTYVAPKEALALVIRASPVEFLPVASLNPGRGTLEMRIYWWRWEL